MTRSAPNAALIELMSEANLGPRELAAEINRHIGSGPPISKTAPYAWVNDGRTPQRAEIRSLAAFVLSQRLGRLISADQIWNGISKGPAPVILALDGLEGLWGGASTQVVLEQFLQGGILNRRRFAQMSGAAITAAVSAYVAGRLAVPFQQRPTDHPLVAQVEQAVESLQYLDDDYGGAANFTYVRAQVMATAAVLVEGGHNAATTRRLQVALADVAQLAGWMAFDAGDPGWGQRLMFLGIRAAKDAGYQPMVAHILGDLSFQASTYGSPQDAVDWGEAALVAAAGCPPLVRASVQTRLLYAYARAGRLDDAHRARESSLTQFTTPDDGPKWLYFFTPAHVESQTGYALIHGGRDLLAQGATKRGRTAIAEGVGLLRDAGAWAVPLTNSGQRRRALFEGAWLATGHLHGGDVEAANSVLHLTIPRLRQVNSPRSVAVLDELRRELSHRQRSEYARSALDELEPALRNFKAAA